MHAISEHNKTTKWPRVASFYFYRCQALSGPQPSWQLCDTGLDVTKKGIVKIIFDMVKRSRLVALI